MQKLYKFLDDNREYNQAVQSFSYRQATAGCSSVSERVEGLLRHIADTQSMPRLDKLALTWQHLFEGRSLLSEVSDISGLASALAKVFHSETAIAPNSDRPALEKIYLITKRLPGFGQKTAALFAKAIFEVNTYKINEDIRFLKHISPSEVGKFYIPVDAVIQRIFSEVGMPNPSFKNINDCIFEFQRKLPEKEKNLQAVSLWDDLWFWGFITQKVEKTVRYSEWNGSKFWVLPGAPKEKEEEIRRLAKDFLIIISS